MKNKTKNFSRLAIVGIALIAVNACVPPPPLNPKDENNSVPESFASSQVPDSLKPKTDTTVNVAKIKWKDYYTDQNLVALIDSALKNNQELNITTLEIQLANNEVLRRKGMYLPFVTGNASAGVDKTSRYTSRGASEENTEIAPGHATPAAVPDLMIGAYATWEVDIWHKLRNAKKSAYNKYLASVEGRNFMITNLVSEISNSYYELLALDNQLDLIKQNIQILNNALDIVRLQKETARVTELAVTRFEAEVFHSKSLQFDIQQKIVETENRINFLVGRFPQPVVRDSQSFNTNALLLDTVINSGVPSQLLAYRPDIRQSEQNLTAAKLDIKVARAQFYPSLNIRAGVGLQAFNPKFLVQAPEAILFGLAGDLMAPLINRSQIKAEYYNANTKQIQAVYSYQQTILTAYIEVANQVSNISNLRQGYELKTQQVDALNESITISTNLFASARANYMEVLLTQRDALAAKFELIDTKKEMMHARVGIYRALGGGW